MRRILAFAVAMLLTMATSAFAVDSRVYGTWNAAGKIGTSKATLTFYITDNEADRCKSNRIWVPADGSESWVGDDEHGDHWSKAVYVEGRNIYFAEGCVTAADEGHALSSTFFLTFNDDYSQITIKGVSDVYSPYTYKSITGTATRAE